MAKAKKFGTFGGVFTPAILTILGVIMYMRMPWVVGNGGMWVALGIVAVAHIVSITTGLSVSSMATDKRVKAGGSYYILSRSLGLPIGGTLGIALFVGLSFSVSLYVIGFSESFLGYFGEPLSTHNIRVVGSVVLFVVAGVTLISTALAIKTQYFIMAAIVISLASVLIGSDLPRPETLHFDPIPDAVPMAVLFGIFFPAVTGFEAGVSMSGDLRDPRRSIPIGTMLAIAVGMLVYIGLAVFFAWRIPAEALANNPRVLLDYAWIEELVIPGIWGATVSSALGSILGAPRILQACAADGIGPRFFERGHGPSNEPRNALLLTTLLAWSGVLVGELDTIARIVSMFFLTSYGFLNLAAFIESWVSPDFRPDFRIPRGISLVGALVCFVLMIQLDFAAMVAATVAMALLYALLKRRELAVEGGDTWAGVWAALVRWSLARLGKDKEHERNWRPHLLSFGGDALRPLAEHICGRAGLLSDLDPAGGERVDWAAREAASRYHGLPGLMPNTVLLPLEEILEDPAGARAYLNSLDPERFNVLISRARGALVPGRVDVWWRGRGGSLAFALALIRALTTVRRWRVAGVRFHLPIAHPTERRVVERRISHWLEQARVRADIRTVDPQVMPPIERLSADAAITILGLPQDPDPQQWAARLEALTRDLPNCLLVRPATTFKNPLGDVHEAPTAAPLPATEAVGADTPLFEDAVLGGYLADIEQRLADALAEPLRHADHAIFASLGAALDELERVGDGVTRRLEHARLGPVGSDRAMRIQAAAFDALLDDIERVPLPADAHGEWVAAAAEAADQALADVVLGAIRAVRVTRVRADDGATLRVAEGRMERWVWGRSLYIQAELAALLAESASSLAERAIERLVAARLQHVTLLHAAVLALADGIAADRVDPTGAHAWRAELGAARRALAATRRNEEVAAAAAARSVADDLARRMRDAPRRWVAPRAVRAASWLDVQELSEDIAPRFGAVDQTLQLTALELRMTIARARLGAMLEDAIDRAQAQLTQGIRAELERLAQAADEPGPQVARGPEFDAALLLADTARAVEVATGMVPETVQVVPDVVIARLEADTEFDGADVQSIAVRQYVGYLLDTELIGGLRAEVRELERVVRRAEDVLRDAARFAADSAAVEGLEASTDAATTEELQGRAEQAREALDGALQAFRTGIAERRAALWLQLAAAEIVRQAGELSRFVRTQKQMQLVTSAARSLRRWRTEANRKVVDLSLRWEGEWGAPTGAPASALEQLVAFRAEVAPSRALLESLPVFYRRAFTGRTVDRELLIGIEAPLAAAAAGVALHDDGGRGSLLITGAPGAGVSTLARLAIREILRDRRVVEVNAPSAATNDGAAFLGAVAEALGEDRRSMVEAVLRGLPRGSVVVLHDIDLWFVRGAAPLHALTRMQELVERLSGRLLFILTTTDSCADLLGKLDLVEPTALSRVRAPELGAGQARDAVMRRHATAGLRLALADDEDPSDLALARHFAGLRALAGGASGAILTSWLAHATAVDGDLLRLRPCLASDVPRFPALPSEALAVANALALHRRIPETTLEAAIGVEARAAALLVRAGMVRRRGGTLLLDPAMRPYLVRWLQEQGALP